MNNIGFIGLGKMGIPMAQNLLKAKHAVSVYNRNEAKVTALVAEGAIAAPNPAYLMQSCNIIILMVADDAATADIFNGQTGLLAADVAGKIVVNMSTVSPQISREMAARLTEKGNFYLDAPVSGSLKQAIEGTLVIMAGGDAETFEKVKDTLSCLGKLALHVGKTGAGNSAKLAINALLSFHAQGLAEAVVFAKNQGIATNDLLALINNSALGNVFMKIKGEAILHENFDAVFALKHISKDLRLAKDEGLNSPLANAAFESFSNAESSLGEEDIIAIIKQI